MLNHTYTSVKNANLVDCGKKQHIPSQPSPLLKDNFLGEFRTELDKKKVLANLGIATSLSLEWANIKGHIGDNKDLIGELNARTKYTTQIGDFQNTVISIIDGIKYLETIVGGEQEGEEEQNQRLTDLETLTDELVTDLEEVKEYLTETIEVNIDKLEEDLGTITEKVNNITDLIQVSSKAGNALRLVSEDELEEGETPGLYVPDLSEEVSKATEDIGTLRKDVGTIQESLDTFVTKEELGGGDFDFVNQDDFDTYTAATATELSNIKIDLGKTVKTGEDGHVDSLFVNTISKNNNDDNIKITDSFEVEAGIPLDIRAVVENLDELCALPAKVCYAGMGVIVNSISALYILRKPAEGTRIDQNYIGNIYNWKCPEDLVTVALTREEYEKLEEVNPNVFYYVYEEEIKVTKEPKPEEFGSTEEYEKAFQDWISSLKVLSQEYMSAAWGVDIENKLGKKANQTSINALSNSINDLQDQINSISGGDGDNSLSTLAERVTETEANLEFLLGTEGTDEEPSTEGKISEIETSISNLDTKVSQDYVSIESITTESDSNNYIFVKKSDYASDKAAKDEAMAKEINTESVKTTIVDTNSINVSNVIVTADGTDLLVNDEEIALIKNVPKIVYLTQAAYDKLTPEEIDHDAYYYTTSEEIYVTKTEFDTKLTQINTSIANLQNQITKLSDIIAKLELRIAALEPSNEPEATN